jgi:hypothetical protein
MVPLDCRVGVLLAMTTGETDARASLAWPGSALGQGPLGSALYCRLGVRRTIGNPNGSRSSLAYVERTSRKLARTLFHAMARHGSTLEKLQSLLGRLVDVAAELYALTSAYLRAGVILRHEAESSSTDRSEIPAVLYILRRENKMPSESPLSGIT